MNKLLIALSSATILALSGCEVVPTKEEATPAPKAEAAPKVEPQAEAVKAFLTEEAKFALAKAQSDTKEAKAKKALWTTAEDALKKAETAAAEFDSQTVIKQSKIASDHAKLGIAQTKYPLTNQ